MISVVIPTLNAEAAIGPTLAALVPGLRDGMVREVIFADCGSADDTAAIAEAVGARLVAAPPGAGPQLGAGAAAARGPWLLFVHAGVRLGPDWPEAARRHIADHAGRAAWCDLRFDAEGIAPALVARWANLRARLFALPCGEQGLLVSVALYRAAGGHPAVPVMKDMALARALGRRRLRPLGVTAVASAARYEAEGWLRRGARNLSRLALRLMGAAPERIARRDRG
jgi:glycosyltransferase involved in cell wall biosynthesis